MGALGLVIGLATYGYNVVRAMGVRLVRQRTKHPNHVDLNFHPCTPAGRSQATLLALMCHIHTYIFYIPHGDAPSSQAKLSPSRGFCAELATALVIMVCSQYGLPSSSSQCITGAIIGVGLCEVRPYPSLCLPMRLCEVRLHVSHGCIFIPAGYGGHQLEILHGAVRLLGWDPFHLRIRYRSSLRSGDFHRYPAHLAHSSFEHCCIVVNKSKLLRHWASKNHFKTIQIISGYLDLTTLQIVQSLSTHVMSQSI